MAAGGGEAVTFGAFYAIMLYVFLHCILGVSLFRNTRGLLLRHHADWNWNGIGSRGLITKAYFGLYGSELDVPIMYHGKGDVGALQEYNVYSECRRSGPSKTVIKYKVPITHPGRGSGGMLGK